MRIADLSVYGVHPARSAGHLAILDPLRHMAERGHEIDILSLGLRSFEHRWPRRFQQEICKGLRETRLVSALALLRAKIQGKTRFPPIEAARSFAELARPQDLDLLSGAEIVILESPWAYGFARSATTAPVLWIAHNQEARLHEKALKQAGLLDRARQLEGLCFREADLVLTLHDGDAQGLRDQHGPRVGPLKSLPLGCEIHDRAERERRIEAKQALGIDPEARVALFAGSAHGPNVQAADKLQALGPEIAKAGWVLLIAGSVRSSAAQFVGGRATGPMQDLDPCYDAADLAINPVEQGSGMNLKNLHAMSRGLPVAASHIGARGFDIGEETGLLEVEIGDLTVFLEAIADDEDRLRTLSLAAHETARSSYSWSAIVDERLGFLARHLPREAGSR